MAKVLVTGGAGFVGRALCRSLAEAGDEVIATTRRHDVGSANPNVHFTTVGDIDSPAGWRSIVDRVDAVVHLAARVHILKDDAADPLLEFRRANTTATELLARAAAAAGVRRFIFVSTIKVLGERTTGRAFSHTDAAAPVDPYSVSKLEAELALRRIAAESGMDFVILRPTLVYGPGVGGNLRRVLDLVKRGIPLPLGSIENARSMVALDNLCSVIALSLNSEGARGETFLVADDAAISTPELFRIVARHMGRPTRLFRFPVSVLMLAGRALGRSAEIGRLCESLSVDIEYTKKTLDWTPGVAPEEGFRAVVQAYLEEGEHAPP